MAAPHSTPGTKHDVLGEVDEPATLFMVFGLVVGLFLLTLWMSSTGMLGGYTIFAQLAIGSVQAGLVAYYFMHLRHGDRVVILTALSSIFWMGILFVLFMSDYMSRHKVLG